MSAGKCELCPGGSSVGSVIGALVGFMGLFFVIFVLLFMKAKRKENKDKKKKKGCCGKKKKNEDKEEEVAGWLQIIDRIKIFYGWLQIFTALTFTFDIQWPIQLRSFSVGLNFINLDLGNILAGSTCSYAVPYLEKMAVHAAFPLMLLVTIFAARIPAHFLRKKNRKKQHALMIKMIFSLALILYPGNFYGM